MTIIANTWPSPVTQADLQILVPDALDHLLEPLRGHGFQPAPRGHRDVIRLVHERAPVDRREHRADERPTEDAAQNADRHHIGRDELRLDETPQPHASVARPSLLEEDTLPVIGQDPGLPQGAWMDHGKMLPVPVRGQHSVEAIGNPLAVLILHVSALAPYRPPMVLTGGALARR